MSSRLAWPVWSVMAKQWGKCSHRGVRVAGTLAVVSSGTTYENGEVTVFSQGECGSMISDRSRGRRPQAVRKLVKSSWSWLLDRMFTSGWVTLLRPLVGSASNNSATHSPSTHLHGARVRRSLQPFLGFRSELQVRT